MSNLQTVQELYEAFGRGDIPAMLERLAEDVQWESWADNSSQRAGVPWFEERRGREGVAEFFAMVGGWEIREFSVLALMEGPGKVAAEIVMDAVPAGGEHFRDEEMHLWDFNDEGLITRLRHYTDTAKHMRAARLAVA
jgi:ketosteroid isomerase-like protein